MKRFLVVFLLVIAFKAVFAQVDAFRTSSYLYNNYLLAPSLAERSYWFVPESFVQLRGYTGQVSGQMPVRNVSLIGNYSTKPDWGYTYRPIMTWSGWGANISRTWHKGFKETTYAPSYYWTMRTKMKNYDRRWDPPAKFSLFVQPQITRYKPRNKETLTPQKKTYYNLRGGATFDTYKFYVGLQFIRLFRNTIQLQEDSTTTSLVYDPLYSAFGSYDYVLKWKGNKIRIARATAVVYYDNSGVSFDMNLEREWFIEDKLPKNFDLHLFTGANYSTLNNSMAIVIGAKRILDRIDGFYKFQKVLSDPVGKVKALHELSVMYRIGPRELDRPDYIERD